MRNADGSIKKKGDEGYLSPNERPFAEQKIGLLPEWATENAYGDNVTIDGKKIKPINKYVVEGTEIYEINDAQAFYEATKAAKESDKEAGIQVELKSKEKIQEILDKGGRLLISKDGKVGMILESNGNAGGGFKNVTAEGKNLLKPLLLTAIKLGARYTDAYDTFLPEYYSKFGFKPYKRVEFNPEFAENGWEDTILKSKPDIVVMYWDGGSREDIEKNYGKFPKYDKTDGEYTTDYEGAINEAREISNSKEPQSSLIPNKTANIDVAKKVETAEIKELSDKDKAEIKRLDDDIEYSESKIEDLKSEIEIEKGNLKEEKERIREEKAKVRASSMSKSDKQERLEELDAELEDLINDHDDLVEQYKDDIAAEMQDIKAAKKEKKLIEEKAKKEVPKTKEEKKKESLLNDLKNFMGVGKDTKVYTIENLDEIDSSNFSGIQKKVIGDIKNVIKAIDKIVKNTTGNKLSVSVHTSEAEYTNAVVKAGGSVADAKTNGFYLGSDGTIHLNMNRVKSDTMIHEGIHPILDYLQANNSKVIDSLYKQLRDIEGGQEFTKRAAERYKGQGAETIKKEALTDFIASIADGSFEVTKDNYEKIRDFIYDLLKTLGIPIPEKFSDIRNIESLKELATFISEGFATGKEIESEKVKGMNESDVQNGDIVASGIIPSDLKESTTKNPPQFSKDEETKLKRDWVVEYMKLGNLSDISGEYMTTTMSDRAVAGDLSYKNGTPYLKRGGALYPLLMKKLGLNRVWASMEKSKLNTLINNLKTDKDGYAYIGIMAMGKQSHMSNIDAFNFVFDTIDAELKDKKSTLTKQMFLDAVNQAYQKKYKKGKTIAETVGNPKLNKNMSIAEIKNAVLENISHSKASFDIRRKFLESLLGNAEKKESRLGQVPNYKKMAALLEEPLVRDSENGDVVAYMKVKKSDLSVIKTNPDEKGHHNSYPHAIESKSSIDYVFLNNPIHVSDIYPDFINKSGNKVSYDEAITNYGEKKAKRTHTRNVILSAPSEKVPQFSRGEANDVKDTYVEPHMTESEDGKDYVFFHVSNADATKLSSGIDSRKFNSLATSRDEKSTQYGVASYYTKPEDSESMVGGKKYVVRVPKDKVYPMDLDPNNYKEMAEKEVPQGTPYRAANIKKKMAEMAANDGYQMAIGEWNFDRKGQKAQVNEFRADALVPLKPTKESADAYESNLSKGMERVAHPNQQEYLNKQQVENFANEVYFYYSSKNKYGEAYEIANDIRTYGGIMEGLNTPNERVRPITREELAIMSKGLPKELAAKADAIQFSKSEGGVDEKMKDWVASQLKAGIGESDLIEVVKEYGLSDKEAEDTVAAAVESIAPPKEPKKKKKRKSLLNRAFRGTSDEKVKAAIKSLGLFYETENQAQAKSDAKEFISQVGDEAALEAVRQNLVEGGRAAFIFAQIIDNVTKDMANAKNTSDVESLLEIQKNLLDEFDRRARAGGQFNAALANVYATSDFNYELTKQIEKYKSINNGIISPQVLAKFEELEKQLNEVNEQLSEAEKRAEEAEEKAAIQNIKDDVNRNKEKETYSQKAKKIADKFRAKFKTKPKFYDENGNEIEIFTSGFTWNDLVEVVAKAIERTGNVADGLKAVSDFVKESDVYKKLTKKGQEALDKQINDYFGEDKTKGRIKVPHSLIRRLVEEGNTDIDSLVAAVKKEIAGEYPDATDREIRDAITGYGKTVNQNQEEIEKAIRKLRFVGRAQSALEDIAMKKRPLKSGAQRDKLDADERKLLKEIKEAMKDLPIDLETQDAQLRTALDAAKTRLRNRIEDLNNEIEAGEVAKKNNKPTITDQVYKDLVEQRDELQYRHDLIFKGKPQTVGEKKIKALKKQLDDLLAKEIKAKGEQVVYSESEQKQIDDLKNKINAAKEEMGLIASKPMPKTEMERAEAKEKAKIEYLEKQLEKLRQGIIEAKEEKAKVQQSQEVKELKAQIQKEKEFLGLIPARPTETQLMELVYDRAIEDINEKIKNNDLAFKKATNKEFSAELEAKKQRLDAAKEELKKLRQEAGIIEARRLDNAKKAVERRIAELERRIREGDFSKKKPNPLIKDNELIKLNAKKLRIKAEFDKLQYQNELNNRNKVQKFYDSLLEIWGLPRALLATGEFSFVLIQGGLYTLSNPRMAKSAFGIAMKSFANENRAKQFLKQLQSQEFYPVMKASKLALTEPDAKLEAREEQFLGGWVNYIWDIVGFPTKLGGEKLYEGWKKLNPIRAVERAGVSYMNMLRVQKFLEGSEMLQAQGKTFETHPKDYKNLADVINTFTGRASLGRGQQFAKELSAVFFSPRNWASMVKQATPYAIYHFGKMGSREEGQSSFSLLMKGKVTPSVAQKMAIKDYMKFVSLTAGIVIMAALYLKYDDDDETEVNTDPTSSDFMKIKLGNTRIDPWGGRIQQVILTYRILSSLSSGDGKSLDYLWKMTQNKFNPSASMTYKYLEAKKTADGDVYVDQFGKPISIQEDLWNSVRPIYWQSFSEINKENPPFKAGMLHAYGLFGGGTQTYKTPTEIMKAKKVSYEDLENKNVADFYGSLQLKKDEYTKEEIEELTVDYAKGLKDLERQKEKGFIKEVESYLPKIKNNVIKEFNKESKDETKEERLISALSKAKSASEKANILKEKFVGYDEGLYYPKESLQSQENMLKRLLSKKVIDKEVEKLFIEKMFEVNKTAKPN
jgi:DNA repair exonuclease SbcCD ATPase subunit